MIPLSPTPPASLNYNITLEYMLSCISIQILTGIFLVCFIVQMHIGISERWTLMRDVLMVGLYDISCKWSLLFFHSCLCTFIPRLILRVLFLSDVFFGARCNYFIINDHNLFLGYVLHGVKWVIGLPRDYQFSSTVPSLVKRL